MSPGVQLLWPASMPFPHWQVCPTRHTPSATALAPQPAFLPTQRPHTSQFVRSLSCRPSRCSKPAFRSGLEKLLPSKFRPGRSVQRLQGPCFSGQSACARPAWGQLPRPNPSVARTPLNGSCHCLRALAPPVAPPFLSPCSQPKPQANGRDRRLRWGPRQKPKAHAGPQWSASEKMQHPSIARCRPGSGPWRNWCCGGLW